VLRPIRNGPCIDVVDKLRSGGLILWHVVVPIEPIAREPLSCRECFGVEDRRRRSCWRWLQLVSKPKVAREDNRADDYEVPKKGHVLARRLVLAAHTILKIIVVRDRQLEGGRAALIAAEIDQNWPVYFGADTQRSK